MRSRGTPFDSVQALRPGRSAFDMSYEYKTTCDMGQLIPVYLQECVPGDVWKLGNQIVARMNPMVSPIMHEINIFVHYFFVPFRLLWSLWESFITGGEHGDDASVLPRAIPGGSGYDPGSLGDYFGFPVGTLMTGHEPMLFPFNAYNLIYNEYYRDENLVAKVNLNQGQILLRAWEKDYFTSALTAQQKGTAPSLPISGTTHAVFPGDLSGFNYFNLMQSDQVQAASSGASSPLKVASGSNITANDPLIPKIAQATVNNNTVDLSNATTFNVSDLRLAFQIQKWMERNNRGGSRYMESLMSHFGVAPRDERLQRPEYIGGSKTPLIVSEVLQTSATGISGSTTPQGGMTGHGLAVDQNFVGKYHVSEFGLIMGIMSIMPRSAYGSQGVPREWMRYTKYDFYWPEFAMLSEQPVKRGEIYADNDSGHNNTVFGYQGRYNEMRYKASKVTGAFRTTPFYTWHLSRIFSSAPLLNQSFTDCVPDKRIFAAPSQVGFLVNVGNKAIGIRPLPAQAEPGLIDHTYGG